MAGRLPGSLHPGAGQEVAQLAVLGALRPSDKVLYAHRGTAYMVGRGVPIRAILADVAGKEGGTNRGKGGVMHVVDVDRGVLGQSGTLGGGFVISVGVGMALQRRGGEDVVVHFFGEGTANRGTFHEALNWAATQALPCVYVCENNGMAVSVPAVASTAVEDIATRADSYGIPGTVVDGTNPSAVYAAAVRAIARARGGDGPSIIEVKTTRLLGHWIGDDERYRSADERTVAPDALEHLQAQLLDLAVLDRSGIAAIEARVMSEIEEAVRQVDAATPLPLELALADVYA
jgi:pyruvate dehydrogenase E1 component alpha subunit